MAKDTYKVQGIKILDGLEAVRARPGMYVGDTSAFGLTTLALYVLDSVASREQLGPTGVVEFDARGPMSWTLTSTTSPMRTCAFERHLKELHGRGCVCTRRDCERPDTLELAVVNALCEELEIDVWFAREQHRLRAARGKLLGAFQQLARPESPPLGAAAGTRLRCQADGGIFEPGATLQLERVAERLQLLAASTRGAELRLVEPARTRSWVFSNGLADLVQARCTRPLLPKALGAVVELEPFRVEVGVNWERAGEGAVLSFANLHHTIEGGPHLEALRLALEEVVGGQPHALRAAVTLSGPTHAVQFEGCVRQRLHAPGLARRLAPVLAEALRAALAHDAGARDALRLAT